MPVAEKPTVSLSKVLNTGVRKHGKTILSNLSVALKLTRLYASDHQNVREALAELDELLQGFIRLQGSVNLTRIDDFLFLNDVRIQVDFGGYETYRFVVDLLKDRDIGDINFSAGVTASQLEKMIQLFNEPPPASKDPWGDFSESLSRHTLPNIDFSQHEEHHDVYDDTSKDARVMAMQTFFKAIATAGKALRSVENGRRINLKSVKNATQSIVDLTLNSEHLLIALTNVKNHGRPGANHAVNVSVLSIALGAKLGLSKRILGDLGIAAMLHDVGKVEWSETQYDADLSALRGAELERYSAHVFDGTERLLKQSMVHQIVKSMNVAFLHHYRYDRTGFPKLMTTREQNLFTRIIAVADHYDNRTTPGRFGSQPDTPETILRDVMAKGGTEFDPVVVKAFVNLLGLYPVGCVVRLDSGDVATVVAPPADPRHLDRPTVRLISDADGNESSGTHNLLDRDKAGNYRRSILKLYQQEEVQLELDEYLAVL